MDPATFSQTLTEGFVSKKTHRHCYNVSITYFLCIILFFSLECYLYEIELLKVCINLKYLNFHTDTVNALCFGEER